jgi:hypothetical protein
MGEVVKFMTRREFVTYSKPEEKKLDLTLDKPKEKDYSQVNERRKWFSHLQDVLCEDDYVEVLEAIIDPASYNEAELEIQKIVDEFYELKNEGRI